MAGWLPMGVTQDRLDRLIEGGCPMCGCDPCRCPYEPAGEDEPDEDNWEVEST